MSVPAETHVNQGPIERDEIFEIVRDRLADILEIDPATISEGQSFTELPLGPAPLPAFVVSSPPLPPIGAVPPSLSLPLPDPPSSPPQAAAANNEKPMTKRQER